ncbi:uncharacterized protein LOC108436880 isoform X3 [Pygocentrus nattereri]|uniref:uncharacterized protein LOC108436880 isoform X3 n=1 Tax=Pygocentrus nattereri TaxID=42514 RepID=UPI0008149E8F|nr:uncharacterized protein LOC108436880 isoform X3 [Pygocentrus nattereri]
MSVRRPALLLPYGLKSWLYAVTRAVVHQKPRDVAEFIATYCQKLYEFGREHPELSIHDLTRLFREVEEGEPASRTFSGSSGSPQDHDPLFHDDWQELLAERKLSISALTRDEISQSCETSRHIQDVNHSDVDPVLSEDLLTKELSCSATSLRSAVFQRSPTPCHAELVKNSVVICTAPSPPDQVIVIHSETLPDTIIFHTIGAVSSESSSGSSSAFRPPTSDQDHVRESCDAGAFADVVIYNKVPSVGDLPYPLSISEDLSSPAIGLDLDQAEAAQNEISETDPSAKVIPCMLSTKIQKEVTEVVSETRVKWKSATASPKISFTTVHKQVSDTAVMKLLRPCMLGLSDDSGVDSYVRVTEVVTETSEKEAESRVPQNTPVPAGKECVNALAASDTTVDSLLATASSNEQLNDAEIHPECLQHAMDELLEQSLEEYARLDLGRSLSDVRVTEAARSVVSSMIDQVFAQDFLETCARATVTEHMKEIQSDLVEDLLPIHDTEKEMSSVCSTTTEPSLEALVLHLCERSVEEILFKAEMQVGHMGPATRLEYLEDREMSLESPEKEQTPRISPEPFLTEVASPVTTESELKMDPSTDEQLSDAERLQVCELELPQHEVAEPVLEELESALERIFEPVPSSDEQQTDAEIYQQGELEVPEPVLVEHKYSGASLLSISETYEKEILAPSAEEETASSPQLSSGQLSTEETSLTYSGICEHTPDASKALETVDSEVPYSTAEPEMLPEAEVEMEHRVVHQVDSLEAPSASPEKQQTLRVSSEPFLTDKDTIATTGATFDPDLSSGGIGAGFHQHSELEIPEQSLQKQDSGVILLLLSEMCEEQISPSSAEEKTASPEAEKHTEIFPDEESDHEHEQTEEEGQSSTEDSGTPSQSGAVLLSVAESFEEEISPSSAEEKTASPEAVRHTEVSPSEESAHELVQTEEGQLSTEKIPSHSDVVQLSVSQTCDDETLPLSTKEEMVSSPVAVKHTLDFPDEEPAHELEQKEEQGQLSTEKMFPSHSGVDLFSVSETCEEETLPSTAERETTSPEEVRHTVDFPGEESAHELKQTEEEGQSSTETFPSHSVSETCEEEISPSSAEEKTVSSPEAVRHTVDFPDEESAHELEQKEEQGQLSTEKMFPSHSVSGTCEEEISPSSAEEKTASSPEAVKHTLDFPDEESAHELEQTEEKQSSTEKLFPSRSGDDLAEKPSLVATEALEIRDSELQCRRGESGEIISEAEVEMEHRVDHQEDSLEAPLESPKKEETLVASLEAFLTDDDGMATTGSLFQKVQQQNENEIPQKSEQHEESQKSLQHEVPEPRLDEHDLEAIQPSVVLKTFEEEPSTSSSEKTSSETEGYTVLSAADESFYEFILTEEENSSSHSGSEKTSDSNEEIKKAAKGVAEKHLASTHLRSYLKKRKAESYQRMEPVDQQLFARMGLTSTDEPCLKRIKSAGAQIVKSALAEKNRFMKRISHSFHLAHKPSAAKDAVTATRHANESQKLQKGRKQPFSAAAKPPRSRRTTLPEVAKQQGSASQVWTLYHVAQASDTSSSSLTAQTSSQSSDAGSELNFETKRPSRDPGINLSECQREKTVTSPRFTMAADAEAISIPNYVLKTEREKATGEKSSDSENKAREKDKKPQAKSQKRAPFPGFLSFVFPMDSFCETEILQMKSSDGKAVYSPGYIRVLYVANDAPEPRRDSAATPPDSARNVEWTLKISVRPEHSTSDTEKDNSPDNK